MHYPTLFVSDLHLGSSAANPVKLTKFLKENSFDKIYLNGDIIDFLAIKRKSHWSPESIKLIRLILKLAQKGVDVVYVYGNHDEELKEFDGDYLANIRIVEQETHHTRNNNFVLVLHGHQFDGAIKSMKWLYWLGDISYNILLRLNKIVSWGHRLIKGRDFSLSLYLKQKTKTVVSKITQFEKFLALMAKEEGCDTVICGHIHIPTDETVEGIRYLNSGCCTEFTSFVVETENGALKHVYL